MLLNNQTKIKLWRSHKNQSTEKRKNKKEARTEGSAFCFVAVTREGGTTERGIAPIGG